MVIRIPSDILVAHLEGESVLLDMGSKNYFRLNATASAIWRGLEAGKEVDQIIDELQAKYDASRATVASGVDETIRELATRKLVQVSADPEDA